MVDSHCHLADEAFADDLELVAERCRAAGLRTALCILGAGDADEAARAGRLTSYWPSVRFATGVHPHQAGTFAERLGEAIDLVRAAAGRPDHLAIGEIGLDYHYDFAAPAAQRSVFGAQLALARELARPVVVHTRDADADTLDVIRAEGRGEVPGVLHCFTGGEALARAALDLGFFLSFAGIVTFPKAEALRAVARLVPADRLLVETDSPYLAPVPYRGKRNEPAWVVRTLETLAEVRGVTADALAAATDGNFSRLFEGSPRAAAGPG